MEPWKDFLVELAKKLTAPFAFAILVILAVAWYGQNIPPVFQALIYVVVIGALVLYALPKILAAIPKRKKQDPLEQPISNQPSSPASSPVEEGPSPEDTTRADYAVARENYLEAILQDCSALRLVGVDPTKADPVRGGLSLEKVYVSLDTRTTVQAGDEGKQKSRQKREELAALLEREKTHPLSALEALVKCSERRMVLLGLPGTGKSTFVRYLTLRMAQAFDSDRYNLPDLLPGWQGRVLLPVIVPLGRLAESLPAGVEKGKAELVEQFLVQMLKDDYRLEDFSPHLLAVLKEEGGLVMFDGLDEVANLNLRPIVIEAVEAFANRYGKNPHNRFLVTCRTYSYYHDQAWQLTGWETHELALLDEPKIKQFVEAWYAEHTRLEPARRDDFAHKKDNLLKSLHPQDRRRLSEIAPFPIILTMMAVVHTHYGDLPDTRAQVYERCTDLLLVRWDLERTVLPGKKRKQSLLDALGVQRGRLDAALREVAFKAHQGFAERSLEKKPAEGPALVTEDLLSGVLQVYLQDAQKVQIFLDYCQSANGLLMLQGTLRDPEAPEDVPPRRVYAFPHQTFQEYLAGRSLDGANIGPRARVLLDSSDRWREVILLLGEYLCFERQDQERMEALLAALAPYPSPKEMRAEDWRALWLAGDLLLLTRRIFVETSMHDEQIMMGLRRLVAAGALALVERAAAADTLDELGWLPPDLYQFISISPGKDEKQPSANSFQPFYIARYPVTNLQYQRFFEADDFADPDLWRGFPKFDEESRPMTGDWGDAGWKWLKSNWDENEKVIPRYWDDLRLGNARHCVPVVGLTWYEANAYCRWLLKHWDGLEEGKQNPGLRPAVVRLPNETEWVVAAGGDDPGDRFPWDRTGRITREIEDILCRANVGGSGLGRTTPVDMYPQGASLRGVWDMAGNVWEWQANYVDKDHDYLALRGGAWYSLEGFARLAGRSRAHPLGYWRDLGFRVLARPS